MFTSELYFFDPHVTRSDAFRKLIRKTNIETRPLPIAHHSHMQFSPHTSSHPLCIWICDTRVHDDYRAQRDNHHFKNLIRLFSIFFRHLTPPHSHHTRRTPSERAPCSKPHHFCTKPRHMTHFPTSPSPPLQNYSGSTNFAAGHHGACRSSSTALLDRS